MIVVWSQDCPFALNVQRYRVIGAHRRTRNRLHDVHYSYDNILLRILFSRYTRFIGMEN